MPASNFPEIVRQIVFEHIDSVEQLEVLLFMRQNRTNAHDSRQVSGALRSNPQSALNRLITLEASGFLIKENECFRYEPRTVELDNAVAQLAEIYKVRPHKIFELIFSPLKKGRQFADAFLVSPPKGTSGNPSKKESDENG